MVRTRHFPHDPDVFMISTQVLTLRPISGRLDRRTLTRQMLAGVFATLQKFNSKAQKVRISMSKVTNHQAVIGSLVFCLGLLAAFPAVAQDGIPEQSDAALQASAGAAQSGV